VLGREDRALGPPQTTPAGETTAREMVSDATGTSVTHDDTPELMHTRRQRAKQLRLPSLLARTPTHRAARPDTTKPRGSRTHHTRGHAPPDARVGGRWAGPDSSTRESDAKHPPRPSGVAPRAGKAMPNWPWDVQPPQCPHTCCLLLAASRGHWSPRPSRLSLHPTLWRHKRGLPSGASTTKAYHAARGGLPAYPKKRAAGEGGGVNK